MAELLTEPRLLSDGDAAPVEIVNDAADSDILLVCEHAGQKTPAKLGKLGLSDVEFESHIAWDIGAEAVARSLSDAIGAPLVVQRYSRLVIDCNRPPGTAQSIPTKTAGIRVPGNEGLSAEQVDARRREIFEPYDRAVASLLAERGFRAVFSIHSFTPDFPGETRPWDLGFLSRTDHQTAQGLIRTVENAEPKLVVTLNEPYQIEDATDWLIPRYAETNKLSHALIEIRNTHISDERGQLHWAALLADAIRAEMEVGP